MSSDALWSVTAGAAMLLFAYVQLFNLVTRRIRGAASLLALAVSVACWVHGEQALTVSVAGLVLLIGVLAKKWEWEVGDFLDELYPDRRAGRQVGLWVNWVFNPVMLLTARRRLFRDPQLRERLESLSFGAPGSGPREVDSSKRPGGGTGGRHRSSTEDRRTL
ncbi:hypothetical protein [Actinopolymorpha rutila]|uniref:Uncharacterized protein n=1 Tax=Actinopolymorpha rutila TaxID=446787 RepID=A0A852Z871_9ACTN|nr:hypothetical protein [Actinopolymorpha rutila]NYH88573.1 hypothetical protein [Actinopolymorpha rutila]